MTISLYEYLKDYDISSESQAEDLVFKKSYTWLTEAFGENSEYTPEEQQKLRGSLIKRTSDTNQSSDIIFKNVSDRVFDDMDIRIDPDSLKSILRKQFVQDSKTFQTKGETGILKTIWDSITDIPVVLAKDLINHRFKTLSEFIIYYGLGAVSGGYLAGSALKAIGVNGKLGSWVSRIFSDVTGGVGIALGQKMYENSYKDEYNDRLGLPRKETPLISAGSILTSAALGSVTRVGVGLEESAKILSSLKDLTTNVSEKLTKEK